MQLVTFLSNPQILKVGRNVKLDLQGLQDVSSSSLRFIGGVDIATIAKKKGVIKDARTGLHDLCAAILHLNLEKDESIRVSREWEATVLSPEQRNYAAMDVWASLEIYHALQAMLVPEPLNFEPPPPPGTPVFIYQEDRTTLIARGQTALEDIHSVRGISVTKTRVVIEVKDVYVPGAVIVTHQGHPLSFFGSVPFMIVCKKSQIRTFVESFIPNLQSPSSPSTSLPTPPTPEELLELVPSHDPDIPPDPSLQSVNIGFDTSFQSDSEPADPHTTNPLPGDLDPFGVEECNRILQLLETHPWPPQKRSGVLKDVFHVFHMLRLTKNHGLVAQFSRSLRDILFLPDPEDKHNIENYLCRQPQPLTWDQCLQRHPRFIKRHCKHLIPPAELLYPLVAKLFKTYGPLKDAQSGLPLFNAEAWKTAQSILKMIKNGFISDPPNISLHYCIGIIKKSGLPVYRCWRGTNFTEGGVHRPIRRSLPISGVSPEHTYTRLKAYQFRHNMLVGTYNMTGQRYHGHFDLWLINELHELRNHHLTRLTIPESTTATGWVNGDLYVQTTEVYGILPVPDNVQLSAGMLVYDRAHSSPPQRHHYLAKKQNTRFAVLTLHTDEEKKLFSSMMREDVTFASAAESSRWQLVAQAWNQKANGQQIFYKVSSAPVPFCYHTYLNSS